MLTITTEAPLNSGKRSCGRSLRPDRLRWNRPIQISNEAINVFLLALQTIRAQVGEVEHREDRNHEARPSRTTLAFDQQTQGEGLSKNGH
ncbi:hypothetical protein XH99_00030 [Bradyrhizobium nanningense]|uniref:Uncharacterized protein n=1 Tax=Bradyrhizobium nanningense TaxID=1325118 RepID=A0A4V1L3P5_9BRAD|nr:hypothetical protein XH99_00030 [Bradyrhizobium nanningense]